MRLHRVRWVAARDCFYVEIEPEQWVLAGHDIKRVNHKGVHRALTWFSVKEPERIIPETAFKDGTIRGWRQAEPIRDKMAYICKGLTKVQERRIGLWLKNRCNFEKVAEIEGVRSQVVRDSILSGQKKLKKMADSGVNLTK